ncbi:hypothetical protein [Methylococcus mesophilus]|uniref:hypothetical protein n=1 Tax=Methylococcus mesophilus TaxID=2993564 RepID=UPI00224B2720|nr:hypothetical protein [Methylococcus mesophilus]UZR27486.1 hypothetical protein OOT43_12150 [Methylococcus mesophilus]
MIGYANLIDIATLSGPGWQTSYPLSNLQNRYAGSKARATGLTGVIDINLGVPDAAIRTFGIKNHNAATIRLQGSSASDFSTVAYDTTVLPTYADTSYLRALPVAVVAPYWRLTLTGTSANPELSRIFLGAGMQPAPENNIEWGASLRIESKTEVAESLSGYEDFNVKPNRRVFRGRFDFLPDADAWGVLLPMMRSQGIHREYLLIADPDDTTYQAQRNMFCRMRELSEIEDPYLNAHTVGVEFSELL